MSVVLQVSTIKGVITQQFLQQTYYTFKTSKNHTKMEPIKYLGTVLRERAVKGRSVTGSLARVMKGRNVSKEVKRSLRNSILFPTLMYGSEERTWNRGQQSGVHAV